MTMRLAFMGTPDFSVPALEALIEAGHEVACVYAQPPRPAGRGKQMRKSPVHLCAEKHGIEVRTPVSLKSPEDQAAFRALDLDAAIVAAYGLLLPVEILEAPRFGCLNIHASLLPRWRGAAPIQRAIAAGDPETGVAIMAMDAGLDTGPVYKAARVQIRPDDTAGSLHDRLAEMGPPLLLEVLRALETGGIRPAPQDSQGAVYAKKIEKSEAKLSFDQPAETVERLIRAFNPFPGAYVELNGERLKILRAELADRTGAPGHILSEDFTIGCRKGAIRPTLIQRAGKAPMDRDAFLRGFQLPVGARLE